MSDDISRSRRTALKSLGALGTGAALSSVGALDVPWSSSAATGTTQTERRPQPTAAPRPIWVWRHGQRETDHSNFAAETTRGELTLQYFGARWDPNPETQEAPAWRHQFFLVGTGYAGASRGYTTLSEELTDQSFGVTQGAVGDPTIVQQHSRETLGFLPPDALMEQLESHASRSELKEFILGGDLETNGKLDYFEAARTLNAEVTDVDYLGPARMTNYGVGLVLIGAGILASGPGAVAVIAGLAAARLIRNGYAEQDTEEVDLSTGFKHEISTEPSYAQMHFAGFEVLTEANTSGDIQISSSFNRDSSTTIEFDFEVEIPPRPEPDTDDVCIDERDVVQGGASPPTARTDDTRGLVLDSPGEPEPRAAQPGYNEQYQPGEPITMEPDLSDDVIEHRWYVTHENDEWCRVNADETGTTTYSFDEPGRASVVLYARNEAGLSAVERYPLEIGEFEDPNRDDGGSIDVQIASTIEPGQGEALYESTVTLDATATSPASAKYEWQLELESEDTDEWVPAGTYPEDVDDDPRIWEFERGDGRYRATLTVTNGEHSQQETITFRVPEVEIDPSITVNVVEDGGRYDGESRAYLGWETTTSDSWIQSTEFNVYDDLGSSDGVPVQHGDDGRYFDGDPGEYTVSVTLTDDVGENHGASENVTLPTVDDGTDDNGSNDDGDDSTDDTDPDPPSVSISGPGSLDLGEEGEWTASASGDGSLSYSWGGVTSGSGTSATWTAGSCGSHTVSVTVSDDHGQSDTARKSVSVTANYCPE